MHTLKILLVIFLCSVKSFQAQCDPVLVPNTMTGCAPLEVLVVYDVPSDISATWAVGTSTTQGTTFTHIFTTPGVYSVSLTTVTNATCLGYATLTVNVLTGPANGCTNTIQGLQSVSNTPEFSIFPNPTSGNLNISISGSHPANPIHYVITNQQGQKIRNEKLSGSFISTSDLEPGIYFVQLKTDLGIVTKKFVKLE